MTPEVGLKLVNPKAGTTIEFTATAESTGGDYVEILATYPPNSSPPPRHLHPSQDEHFTVLSGSMHGSAGDDAIEAGAGEEFKVLRGTPHLMSAGPDGAVLRWRTSPALRTGEMYCAMWQVAHDNDWSPDGMAVFNVITGFSDEFCLC